MVEHPRKKKKRIPKTPFEDERTNQSEKVDITKKTRSGATFDPTKPVTSEQFGGGVQGVQDAKEAGEIRRDIETKFIPK